MIIEKTAKTPQNYKKPFYQFESAREGFSAVIRLLGTENTVFLLPAYIGLSPNEGSGIFDPIAQNHAKYVFYRLDNALHIDTDDLVNILDGLKDGITPVLLLVHYFGFVDPAIDLIVKEARKRNAFIIEDEAHAMFTDLVDGRCGQYGDVSLFSLHKMLPFCAGGLVRDNTLSGFLNGFSQKENGYDWMAYDLRAISNRRKANSRLIYDLLKDEEGIVCLRTNEFEMCTPQTYPILVPKGVRNELYFALNDAGYGLVSLYHTMIPQIMNESVRFADSIRVSTEVTNLPVHQDVREEDLKQMVGILADLVDQYHRVH